MKCAFCLLFIHGVYNYSQYLHPGMGTYMRRRGYNFTASPLGKTIFPSVGQGPAGCSSLLTDPMRLRDNSASCPGAPTEWYVERAEKHWYFTWKLWISIWIHFKFNLLFIVTISQQCLCKVLRMTSDRKLGLHKHWLIPLCYTIIWYFVLFKHSMFTITFILLFFLKILHEKEKERCFNVFKKKTDPERQLGNMEQEAETGFLAPGSHFP